MKLIKWIGSSYKDLLSFPEDIRQVTGYALYLAQKGEKHPSVKIFKGIGNAKVLEIRENSKSGTYRIVYTVEKKEFLFVLHAFQKKSKKGISTPKKEVDLIKKRLGESRVYYQ